MSSKKNNVIALKKSVADYNATTERDLNIIGRKIAEARHKAGLNIASFSNLLTEYGVSVGVAAISKWECGNSAPNAYQMIAVSRALQIPELSYFTSNPPKEDLNDEGKRKLQDYKEDLIASGKYTPYPFTPKMEIVYREMPISCLTVSAGTGAFLDEGNYEMVSFPEDAIPASASFGVRVSGDSMEPVYHDGQIVWVEECVQLQLGEVGVFVYDGQGYLKVYGEQTPEDKETYTDSYGVMRMQPVMISYNPEYAPKVISPDAEFKIVGRVIR